MTRVETHRSVAKLMFSILALLILPSQSFGELMTWNVQATLEDGGTIAGTIEYDYASNPASLASWNVTVNYNTGLSYGFTSPFTFTETYPQWNISSESFVGHEHLNQDYTYVSMRADVEGHYHETWTYWLKLDYLGDESLLASGAPIDLVTLVPLPSGSPIDGTALSLLDRRPDPPVYQWFIVGVNDGATLTPVPIPPASLMFGTGLIGLAWARRKQLLGR